MIKSSCEEQGLAFGGGLGTTKSSFLGMLVSLTGSGASPRGGVAIRVLCPAPGAHFADGATSQSISPADEAGYVHTLLALGRTKMSRRDVLSVLC